MSDERVIDYWCNLFTADGLRRLYLEPPEFAWPARAWSLSSRLSGRTVQEFVEMMDELGIGRVGLPAAKVYNWRDHRMIWDLTVEDIEPVVTAAPDRFFGLFGIDPHARMAAVREFERAVSGHGFAGGVIHPHGFGLPPDAAEWFPFYAKAVELDVPVLVLVGHAAEEMPSEPGRPLHLEKVALYFPELRIVGVSGWPWVAEMVSLAWKFPNVYYGTSQYSPRHWDAELLSFVGGRGRGKVLFGTGFPVLDHRQALAEVAALDISAEAREQLLRGAARAVFSGGAR